MNIIFTAAEVGVSYLFPQVGAALQTYRYARTAYSVGRIAASYMTGDIVGGSIELARAASREACLQQRDNCISACMRSGMWSPGVDTGACVLGCDMAYRTCVAMLA